MRTYLFKDSKMVTDMTKPLEELPYFEYLKKRVQFWKYSRHRTMGRPVLRRRLTAKDIKELFSNE